MSIRVKVVATDYHKIDESRYQEDWESECDEDGHEEGNEYPPMPTDWLIDRFWTDIEEGNISLDEVLAGDVEVTLAP